MSREVKPVYAVVGDDSFLQVEAVAQLSDHLARSFPGADVQKVSFDGESAELAQVLDEVRSFSMFGGSKLVVVRGADEFVSRHRDGLERFCQSLEDPAGSLSGVLVLRLTSLPANTRLFKLISRIGEVVRCEPPRASELTSWLARRAKSVHGVELVPQAAAELADLIGPDLGRLDAELGRLALMLPEPPGPQLITPDLVRSSVTFQREQEVREVVALLARGRVADALMRWRQILTTDPSAEYKAATWLMLWLERARQALDLKESGAPPQAIARATWINDPTEQREFMAVAARLGRRGIARLFDRLTELDRRSKTGLGVTAVLVERWMATAIPPLGRR